MHEIAVPFIVIIGPTIFALVLEIVSEDIRKTIWWRIGVVVFGVGLSLLTLWQLTSERHTAANEREQAIKDTSQQVAAETSTQVTRAVTEQFKQTVAEQQKKIDQLQTKLDAQGKDVATIKGSNIVTGKYPIKVEVTNEPGTPASLQVENIRLFAEPESSTHRDAPYAKKVTIQTDVPVNPIRLAISCESPLKYGELGHAEEGSMWIDASRIYEQDRRMFVIDIKSPGTPMLRPDAPLVFHLYSDKPINITKLQRGPR
jgi:hypothetical protein